MHHLRRPRPHLRPTYSPPPPPPPPHRYTFISSLLFAPKRAVLGLRQIGLDLPECHFLYRCYVFTCSKCVFVWRFFFFFFFPPEGMWGSGWGGGGGVVLGEGLFFFFFFFSVRLGAASGVCAIWQMPRAQKKR